MMLSSRLWLAPITLFALQASPVALTTDSTGRLRLTVGGGLGSYQEVATSCSGEVLDQYDVPFQQVGAQADLWLKPKVRVTGYGGAMFADPDRQALEQINPPFQGGYGGALVAGEWRSVGAGAGVSVMPGESMESDDMTTRVYPAAYLRLGPLDAAHFRADVFGPPGAAAPPHFMRLGVGFGQGHRQRTGGFLGLGMSPFPIDDRSMGLTADLLVSVSASLDVGGSAALRTSGEDGLGFNLGLMLRMKLGPPPR